jgi:hypothetical protein
LKAFQCAGYIAATLRHLPRRKTVKKALFASAICMIVMLNGAHLLAADKPAAAPAPAKQAETPKTETAKPAAQPVAPAPAQAAPPAVQKAPEAKPAVPAGPPPRPPTRTIARKAGDFIYTLRMKPGVPEPGDMVEFVVDAVETLKVPHPVYGDRMPLGGARIIARVVFEKAPDVVFKYAVQPVGDEGTYGFHYTPEQIGKYSLTLSVKAAEDRSMEARFSFPVGLWPLPPDTDTGDAIVDEGGAASKLGRARQRTGSVAPVGPVGPETAAAKEKSDALKALMRKLERLWLYLGKDILADRKPDLNAIGREAEGAVAIAKKAAGMVPQDLSLDAPEFDQILTGLVSAAGALSAAAKAGEAEKSAKMYKEMIYNYCTRCHLKFRFRAARDLAAYPAVQDGR